VVAFAVSRPWSQADEPRQAALIETDAARDEYPIRHAWTFAIPPTPADPFAASKER
jgi:hypothetical protein